MKSEKCIRTTVLVYLAVSANVFTSCVALTDKEKEDYDKTKDALLFMGEAYGMMALMGNYTNFLGSAGKILQVLGPITGIVGNLLNLVNVYMPQEDPIIEKLDLEFGKLNARLDNVNYKLDWLPVLTKFETAKSAYRRDMNSVLVVKNALDTFMKSSLKAKKAAKGEFMHVYRKNFPDAIEQLYLGIVELRPSSLGVDLLELFSEQHRCNALKIAQLCADLATTFSKGMEVVGAYHGLKKNTAFLKQVTKKWQSRMKKFGQKCQALIDKCVKSGWKKYINGEIDFIFKEKASLSSNNDIANFVRQHLDLHFPYMIFYAAVHNDVRGYNAHGAWGFDEGCTNTYTRWHNSYSEKALTVGKRVKTFTPAPSKFTRANIKSYIRDALREVKANTIPESRVTSKLRDALKKKISEGGYLCGKSEPKSDYYQNLGMGWRMCHSVYLVNTRIGTGVSTSNNLVLVRDFGIDDGVFLCKRTKCSARFPHCAPKQGETKCHGNCKVWLFGTSINNYVRKGDHTMKTTAIVL